MILPANRLTYSEILVKLVCTINAEVYNACTTSKTTNLLAY